MVRRRSRQIARASSDTVIDSRSSSDCLSFHQPDPFGEVWRRAREPVHCVDTPSVGRGPKMPEGSDTGGTGSRWSVAACLSTGSSLGHGHSSPEVCGATVEVVHSSPGFVPYPIHPVALEVNRRPVRHGGLALPGASLSFRRFEPRIGSPRQSGPARVRSDGPHSVSRYRWWLRGDVRQVSGPLRVGAGGRRPERMC